MNNLLLIISFKSTNYPLINKLYDDIVLGGRNFIMIFYNSAFRLLRLYIANKNILFYFFFKCLLFHGWIKKISTSDAIIKPSLCTYSSLNCTAKQQFHKKILEHLCDVQLSVFKHIGKFVSIDILCTYMVCIFLHCAFMQFLLYYISLFIYMHQSFTQTVSEGTAPCLLFHRMKNNFCCPSFKKQHTSCPLIKEKKYAFL